MLNNFKNNPKETLTQLFKQTLEYPLATRERDFEDYQAFESFSEEKYNYTPNPQKLLKDSFIKLEVAFSMDKETFNFSQDLFSSSQSEDEKILQSYLFVVLHLRPRHYTRTELTDCVRELNRIYTTGVFVAFAYACEGADMATFGVIDRRKNKIDDSKTVLQKVTLIKDINTQKTHRGHLNILKDLSWANLNTKLHIQSIDQMHEAWAMVLDIKLLNENFFKEIRNWYFWASKTVKFPQINPKIQKDNLIHQQESVIRLLTRLFFCWFLKEKGFIPEDIFELQNLKNTLKNFDENHTENSDYYKAVLQNLFFATLNVPANQREYYIETKKYDKNVHLNQNIYRYAETYQNPENIKAFFEKIPFLNGGLFECLDQKLNDNNKETRLDGFSVKTNKQANVPNLLFFAKEHKIDLSEELGNKKMTQMPINGLFNILNKYKFTVEENTPLEQDIALDPEMLGQIFESLLAYFNTETKEIARKSTGSFYTPKEIVQYMTEESLNAFLINAFKKHTDFQDIDITHAVRNLLNEYTENPFSEKQNTLILEKIYTDLKIFDPACGSGAFPMGILDKLVKIVRKLDQNNNAFAHIVKKPLEQNKQKLLAELQEDKKNATIIQNQKAQKKAIDELDEQIQEIEKNFETNGDLKTNDYARKLYLIQNCIYGVDIQQIAVQISKLRFFIALIIEQKRDDLQPNFGVETLPNLETKIICANTLVKLEKTKEDLFNTTLVEKEKALQENRNQYFNAQNQQQKHEIKKIDAQLRNEIAEILQKNKSISKENAQKLIDFDIFSQNAQASWFDMKQMFDVKEGFDIVIGNPPYVRIYGSNLTEDYVKYLQNNYVSAIKKFDLYVIFVEMGIKLLNPKGVISYIIPDKWLSQPYGENLRNFILENCKITFIHDLTSLKVFQNATVDNVILNFEKNKENTEHQVKIIKSEGKFENMKFNVFEQSRFQKGKPFLIDINETETKILQTIGQKSILLQEICYVNWGCRPSPQEEFIANSKIDERYKTLAVGSNITKYFISENYRWVKYVKEMYNPMFKELFENETLMFKDIIGKGSVTCALNTKNYYSDFTVINAIKWEKLENVSYSRIKFPENYKKYKFYSTKVLLAFVNSKVISFYFDKKLKNGLHTLPNGVKSLPIPAISAKAQLPFEVLVEYVLWLRGNEGLLVSEYVTNSHISSTLEEVIDACVFELYFGESVRQEKAEVLKYINAEYGFEAWNNEADNEAKRLLIGRVYEAYRQKEHPARNGVLLQKYVNEISTIYKSK